MIIVCSEKEQEEGKGKGKGKGKDNNSERQEDEVDFHHPNNFYNSYVMSQKYSLLDLVYIYCWLVLLVSIAQYVDYLKELVEVVVVFFGYDINFLKVGISILVQT